MNRLRQIADHVSRGNRATFTGILYTNVGVERGKAPNKVRYGDATVCEVIVTGFSYASLVQRSIDAATKKSKEFFAKVKAEFLSVSDNVNRVSAMSQDEIDALIQENIDEQITSWKLHQITPKDEPHFKPLIVDGVPVVGAKVYDGEGDGKNGEIYLAGLRISRKVIADPPNGYWVTNSSTPTIIKDIVRDLTPIGRYVTRRLSPGNLKHLRVGGAAADYAESIGMEIPDAVVDYLKELDD